METRSLSFADVPVYVLHGSRNEERRRHVEGELERHGIEARWLLDINISDLTPEVVRRYYRPGRMRWLHRSAATWRTRPKLLQQGEIAAAASHVETLRLIGESGAPWSLVLEDDIILAPDFRARFDEYFHELPVDADVVFIGSCLRLRIKEVEEGRHLYRKEHPASKCADSYLVTAAAARRIVGTIVPFVLPIDWELNYQFKRHDLAVYWLEPPLVEQGSETGLFSSHAVR
jgi:glycosyl transferase family 25